MGYARPTDLDQAVSLLARQSWTVLAGGTDLYPATAAQQLAGPVLDLGALADLRGIQEGPDGWRIGACTTWADIAQAKLPCAFKALQQAAVDVGGIQIQNAGTVGGNLCNASPAADGVPPLLVLDASVELASKQGIRTLPLSVFLTGPRQTARTNGELLTGILIPSVSARGTAAFQKLGARRYLVISIAMTAARLTVDQGHVQQAALAVGACSATARRLPKAEAALQGQPVEDAEEILSMAHLNDLSPIDDVRGSAAYRMDAALELLRRTVRQALA